MRSLSFPSGDCLICREGMDSAKKLPCGHMFHLDCLRMWLQHQQSCPLCRSLNSTCIHHCTFSLTEPCHDILPNFTLLCPILSEKIVLRQIYFLSFFLTCLRAEIPVTAAPVDSAAENSAATAGDAAADADLIPPLEEARMLAEAVQGHQNRSSRGASSDGSDNRLPCFFAVSENSTVDIRTAPSNASQLVRTLKKVRTGFIIHPLPTH